MRIFPIRNQFVPRAPLPNANASDSDSVGSIDQNADHVPSDTRIHNYLPMDRPLEQNSRIQSAQSSSGNILCPSINDINRTIQPNLIGIVIDQVIAKTRFTDQWGNRGQMDTLVTDFIKNNKQNMTDKHICALINIGIKNCIGSMRGADDNKVPNAIKAFKDLLSELDHTHETVGVVIDEFVKKIKTSRYSATHCANDFIAEFISENKQKLSPQHIHALLDKNWYEIDIKPNDLGQRLLSDEEGNLHISNRYNQIVNTLVTAPGLEFTDDDIDLLTQYAQAEALHALVKKGITEENGGPHPTVFNNHNLVLLSAVGFHVGITKLKQAELMPHREFPELTRGAWETIERFEARQQKQEQDQALYISHNFAVREYKASGLKHMSISTLIESFCELNVLLHDDNPFTIPLIKRYDLNPSEISKDTIEPFHMMHFLRKLPRDFIPHPVRDRDNYVEKIGQLYETLTHIALHTYNNQDKLSGHVNKNIARMLIGLPGGIEYSRKLFNELTQAEIDNAARSVGLE